MPPRSVLTLNGERASAHARAALALYRQLAARQRSQIPRLGQPASTVTPEQLILPRAVSIAEDYARSRLIQITEDVIRLQHPVEVLMWTRTEESAEASWENLGDAWSNWHQVDLAAAPTYNELRGYVEARNSILHGLGELTRKQTRGRSAQRTRSRLGHAHITLDGRRLRLRSDDIDGATRVTVDFIEWLDRELLTRGLVTHN